MPTQMTDLIQNGDFGIIDSGNWANWQSVGVFDAIAGGANAPTHTAEKQTNTLTYAGLTGLDSGPGANGTGQLTLDVAWNDATSGNGGAPTVLEIRIAGVLLATITTPDGDGVVASITYFNGASGNLLSLTESGFGAWALQQVVIELPASIPAQGSIEITTSNTTIADDIRIDNVSLVVTETVPDGADAIDDAISVTEDEALGEANINLLTNDFADMGQVDEVNGAAGDVGATVTGSNGGVFIVSADGSLDFSAVSDFDSLGVGESATTSVTYTLVDTTPFDAGSQTVTSSAVVGTADQVGTLTLSTGRFTNDGTTPVAATIDLTDVDANRVLNVVFVVDTSGSTQRSFTGGAQSILEAEVEALQNLSDDLAALNFPPDNIEVALVSFADVANYVGAFEPGSAALDAALSGLTSIWTTNYEAALDAAGDALTAMTAGVNDPSSVENLIYFLSDGEPLLFSGDPQLPSAFEDEADSLVATFGADIIAVGVGDQASLENLNVIDTTVGSGQSVGSSAVQVLTTDSLAFAMGLPTTTSANLIAFRILIDGAAVPGIDINDLPQSGTSFILDLGGEGSDILFGLTTTVGATSEVIAEATFDDGTVLSSVVDLDAAPSTTDTAIVTVTVTGLNDVPDAIDDSTTVGENTATPVTIDLTGNDLDPDLTDELAILSLDINSTLGLVTVNADNYTVDYDPTSAFDSLNASATAIDTFTYTVTDGNGGTDIATVTVIITGANDDPVAVDDGIAVGEDDGASSLDLTANDFDPDAGDVLDLLSVDASGALGLIDAGNDNLTYSPNGQFNGLVEGETALDTFTYTVTDGNGGQDTGTVTVTITGVNDDPTAIDDSATVGEDDAPITIDLTANDADPDLSDDLEILSIDTAETTGMVTINADGDTILFDPNGEFEFLSEGETTQEDFVYTVTDGNGSTDLGILTITVTGVNDGPTAIDDDIAVFDPSPFTINLTMNDTDPDLNDDLEILGVNTAGTLGMVTVNGDNDSVNYDPTGALSGDSALDTFTYTITDGNGGQSTATVTVAVFAPTGASPTGSEEPTGSPAQAPLNQAPFIQEPVSFQVLENQNLAANLLAFDPDNDALTWSISSGSDAALFSVNPTTGALTFNTVPDFEAPLDMGADNDYELMVQVSDGLDAAEQAVLVRVQDEFESDINQAPIIQPIFGQATEVATVFLDVSTQGLLTTIELFDQSSDTIEFRLFGEDASLFDLDPATGMLSLLDAVPGISGSFDTDSIYELTVQVLDTRNPMLTDELEILLPLLISA